MAKALTREDFLAAKFTIEPVEIAALGGTAYVRELSSAERDSFEASVASVVDGKRTVNQERLRAKLAARCLVDEDGKRLFTDAQVEEVGDLPSSIVEAIFPVAQRLSGMAQAAVDDAAKN